jgi:U3 small nucleolar RNA-associated protein 12
MKRRTKRVKSKSEQQQQSSSTFVDEEHEAGEMTMTDESLPLSSQSDLLLVDELEVLNTIRCTSKIRSFAFNPMPTSPTEDMALVSLTNNTLELYKIPHGVHLGIPAKASIVDLQGHRSDVRGLTVSNDGNVIASCSAESVKLWSSRSLATTGTCLVDGYCISICFAPGGRYVLTGTKDGRLQVCFIAYLCFLVHYTDSISFLSFPFQLSYFCLSIYLSSFLSLSLSLSLFCALS